MIMVDPEVDLPNVYSLSFLSGDFSFVLSPTLVQYESHL